LAVSESSPYTRLPPFTGVPSSGTWWLAGSLLEPLPPVVPVVAAVVAPVVAPVVAAVVSPVVVSLAAAVVVAAAAVVALAPVAATTGPEPLVVLVALSSLPHAPATSAKTVIVASNADVRRLQYMSPPFVMVCL
jgi:hypothetical protein